MCIRDSISLIVKCFGENFGLRSLILKGAKKTKSRFPLSYFEPLSLLSITAYNPRDNRLITPLELSIVIPQNSTRLDFRKQSIALFMTEVLQFSISHNADKALYSLIRSLILELEAIDEEIRIFPIYFLNKLTRELGISPEINASDEYKVAGLDLKSDEHIVLLHEAFGTSFDATYGLSWNADQRRTLLNDMLMYIQYHIGITTPFKSHKVLEAVLS